MFDAQRSKIPDDEMARFPARIGALLLAGASCLWLSACVSEEHPEAPFFGDARHAPKIPVVPDTGSMNAERFGDETFPVFMRPAPTPLAMQLRGYSPAPAMSSYPPPASSLNDPPPPLSDQTSLLNNNSAPQVNALKKKQQSSDVIALTSDIYNHYGPVSDNGLILSAIPIERVDPRLLRQRIDYETTEKPGTLIVDTKAHYLYLVEGNGQAVRYGVSLGREGYGWTGRGIIRYKEQWPRWTPTAGMVKDNPDLRQISADRGGLVAGVDNPLGARALYIYQNGKDTLYRVHGTPEWRSIGKQASSGCVRMFNQDVIDLYNRVRDGAEIVVL